MSVSARTSQAFMGMRLAMDRLKEEASSLGLNLSAWDEQLRVVEGLEPACEFCRCVCDAGGPCRLASAEMAKAVCADGKPARTTLPLGCTVIGVPITQRRRLFGAAVACYPTREMRDEELLARLCDKYQLDREVMARHAQGECRHSAEQACDIQHMLELLQDCEQGLQTANSELATLSLNLATTYEELSLLYRISGSMKVNQSPRQFIQNVCDELLGVMNISSAAALVTAHAATGDEEIVVIAGDPPLDEVEFRLLAEKEIHPRFEADNRAFLKNNHLCDGDEGRVRDFIAVPLLADEQRIGMIVGVNKVAGDFNSVDLKLISSVGNQASAFLNNNRLYVDIQDLLMGVLHALTATIDAKDPYTCGHSQRVAMISRRLAEECGLPPAKVQQIYLAGLLHDIGKIGVPEAVLRKPGRLTDSEFEDIKRHPGMGARILGGIRQLDDIISGILTHHERLDGRGYPQGLKGNEIPIEGRIVGLADSFDAMTSDRTYRRALSLETVKEEIRRHAGTQFDAAVVERFLAMDLEAYMEELRQPARTVFPVSILQEPSR